MNRVLQARYTPRMNSRSSTGFRLGIVTGLRFEATIAQAAVDAAPGEGVDTVLIACHGPGQARAMSAGTELIDAGASALMSLGVSGGCNPDLAPGTVVIATGVRDLTEKGTGEVLYTNREWQRRLRSHLLGHVVLNEALIGSTDEPVTSISQKTSLFGEYSAAAVDMESAAVARSAVTAGVPYIAIRVIVDPSDLSLPKAALAGFDPTGGTDAGAVLRSVIGRPTEIPALIRLGLADRKARQSLGRAARAAAPMFGAV